MLGLLFILFHLFIRTLLKEIYYFFLIKTINEIFKKIIDNLIYYA
jgi:hypothetical protein